MNKLLIRSTFLLILLLAFSSISFAALDELNWTTYGVPLCTQAQDDLAPQAVNDGSGGAIITWHKKLSTVSYDIYAQRISSSGEVLWGVDGIPISVASERQMNPKIVSDGAGGAIIVWQDYRNGTNYDIYAQRVNGSGVVQWLANGITMCASSYDQYDPQIASDGSGGAIIAWSDYRSNSNWDIYAQRVNGSGAVQWTVDGNEVTTAVLNQYQQKIISDGSGGAILAWTDNRQGSGYDIVVSKINSSGTVQWWTFACGPTGDQDYPEIISDGSGGAIVTWMDFRTGLCDIYARRVNSAGTALWTTDGVAITTATNAQQNQRMVSDGSGGAIITWEDKRGGTYFHIYAGRVNSNGNVQGTLNGVDVAVTGTPWPQEVPCISSDIPGSAIIAWQDYRGGHYDIYAQRLDISLASQWGSGGRLIGFAAGDQKNPAIVCERYGGAIIAWEDNRNGNFDIYAQGLGKKRVNNQTKGKWYFLIQEALNDASASDLITAEAINFYEHDIIWPNSNNITLRGAGPNATIISAEALGRVINVGSSGIQLTMEALTIKDGLLTGSSQGGAGVNLASSNLILNLNKVNFIGNRSIGSGGCAGAIYSTLSIVKASNCTFDGNAAAGYGGVGYRGNWDATNCIFSNNSAWSGGVVGDQGNWNVTNCIFFNNNAASGPDVFFANAKVKNSIFWGNGTPLFGAFMVTAEYSDVQGGYSGKGNININPLFLNASVGNFHLLATSECVNSGTFEGASTSDLDGNPRPLPAGTLLYDMGAYEQLGILTPTITVIQPNGGEILNAGTTYSIKWNISGNVTTDAYLRLSTDAGLTWDTLITREPGVTGTSTYTCTVPFISSKNCLVSVEAGGLGGWSYDRSNSTFEIFINDPIPPVVTVDAPAAGEKIRGGSVYQVIWRATDNLYVMPGSTTIEASFNNGVTWEIVTSGTGGSQYYWNVNPVNTTQARIRIRVQDLVRNTGIGTSGAFVIDSASPEVLTTSPTNGATGVLQDTNIVITFSETIETSTVVVTMEPKVGWTETWEASNKQVTFDPASSLIEGQMYWVTVEAGADDIVGNTMISPYRFNFRIRDVTAPIVTALKPATGEALRGNSQYLITWEATDNVAIKPSSTTLEVSLNNSATWANIVSWRNASPYSWTVTAETTTEAKIRVTAQDTSGNVGTGTGGKFIIDSTPPSVLTTSPLNGSKNISVDTYIVITFSETMETSTVVVTMEPKVGWEKSWNASNKQVTFDPVSSLIEGQLYRVTVEAGAKDMVGNSMVSPYAFTFEASDLSPPTVTVLRPATSEALRGSAPYLITWEATDNVAIKPSSTTLEVSLNNGATWANIVSWRNASPYSWTVTAETTTEAKIRVTAQDTSGNVGTGTGGKFVIDSTAPSVTATVPQNGEKNVSVATNIIITFSETMETSTVVVTMEPKVGWAKSWNASSTQVTFDPASSLIGGQTYRTTIEAGAKDKVGNTMASSYSFTFEAQDVTPPLVTVEAPNGSEVLSGGSYYDIKWKAADDSGIKSGGVTISYSLNSGSIWTQIISGLSNTGSHMWNVPLVSSSNCRVKVEAEDNVGLIGSDISNNNFTIILPAAPTLEVTINGRMFLDDDVLPPDKLNTINIKALDAGVVNMEMWLDGMSVPLSGPVGIPPEWSGTFIVTPDSSPLHELTFYAYSGALGGAYITLEAQVITGGVKVVGIPLNYPNPFKPMAGGTTKIQYTLTDDSNVTLILFDITGQEVKRMAFTAGGNGGKAGINMIEWDGKSLFGEVVGNGMYIYKIISGGSTIGTGKLVVRD